MGWVITMKRSLKVRIMGTVLLTIVVSGVACVQVFANASLPADREGDAMLSPEQAWSAPPADDKPTETYLQIIDDSANKPGDGAQERKNPAVARDLRALAAPTEHASKLRRRSGQCRSHALGQRPGAQTGLGGLAPGHGPVGRRTMVAAPPPRARGPGLGRPSARCAGERFATTYHQAQVASAAAPGSLISAFRSLHLVR